jgi:hypothetical protein
MVNLYEFYSYKFIGKLKTDRFFSTFRSPTSTT